MGSGYNMQMINECSSADIDRFLGVLLENGHLPWVLSELTVSIHIHWVLYPAVDSLRVAATTLTSVSTSGNLRPVGPATTHMTRATLLLLLTLSQESLTLKLNG